MSTDLTPELALEIWLTLNSYVNPKERAEAVERYLAILEDFGYDMDDLYEVEGQDKNFDKALDSLLEEEDDEDDDSFDDYEE